MSLKYVLGCSAAIGAVVLSGTAVAQDRTFNIPYQDITSAISVFGRQSGLQIVAPASRLQGVQSRPVVGRMDARAALRQLIAGSDLEVASDSGGVIVLRLPAPTTGSAQTDQSVVLDEVVVTGSRYQGREEVRRKAAATTVVDTLSQDDTGDLPDQSMAEALRRIPGIATLYDEDEGQFVTIRGIQPSLNYTTLDGLGLAAVAGNGNGARRVDLSLIPSQSARRAEAYKTFTADMDAGVVGGLINIVPRSAYDQRRNTFGVLDVYANYFTYGDVPGVNSLGGEKDSPWGGGFNGIWSRRFGQNDQFGLVLSANFQQKQRDTVKPGVATWGFYTDAGATTTPDEDDWNGVAAPSQFQIHAYTNRIRNGGGSARFEWKPSDRWYNSLLLFGYTQGEQETRNSNALQSLDQPQGLTAEGGDFRTRAARVFYTQQLFDRSSRGAQYHSTFRPDDVSTLDFNFGYSTATFENHSPLITYQANPATRLQYVGTGEFPTFTLTDTATYLNPAAYKLTDAQWSDKAARAEQSEVKLDYARNVGPDSLGFGWQAGVDFRRYHLWRDFDYTLYNTDNSTLAALAIDPQYTPDGWPYPVLWMDNDAFWADVAPGLAVNARASARDC